MKPPPPNNSFCIGGMARLLIPLFICALSHISAAQEPLRIVDSYQSPPGTINVILQNEIAEPMKVELKEIGAPDEKLTIPFWWSKVADESIAPGARTHMIVSMTRPVAEGKELKFNFLANQKELTLALKPHSRTPLLRYAVQDAQSGKIYLYLVNEKESPIVISGFKLNGLALQGGNAVESLHLSPYRGDMFYGECPDLRVADGGVLALLVDYNLGNETFTEAAYLFSSTQFSVGLEDTQNIVLDCPTHKYGTWMGVGQKILETATASTHPIPTVHFCRERLSQGLPAFAQAVPRIRINPQASNLHRGKVEAVSGYFDVLEMARTYVRPGIATALIENTSIFQGNFGALRNPEDAPLSEQELLFVSLGALAHGAKGLDYRVEVNQGEEYARRVQYLLIRFELLRPFLSIGEVLPLELSCGSEKVIVQCMLCGNKGMLIFVLRKDFSDSGTDALPPFELSVAVPKTLTLNMYAEVSAGKERGTLSKLADNTYGLTINNFESASVYFCAAAQ